MDLVCRWWGTDLATAALLFSVRDRRITSTVIDLTAPAALTSTLDVLASDLVEPFMGRAGDSPAPARPRAAHPLHHQPSVTSRSPTDCKGTL